MPNGRSGGFRISTAQFRELLQGIPGETSIGSEFAEDENVSASDLAQRLDQIGDDDLPVEEEDYSWYIAHLGTDCSDWVTIEESSPLYGGFRQCHQQWIEKTYTTKSQSPRGWLRWLWRLSPRR